jgi:hypothetical protein
VSSQYKHSVSVRRLRKLTMPPSALLSSGIQSEYDAIQNVIHCVSLHGSLCYLVIEMVCK